ncbi:MAG: glycosyltransferase family 2 protein [Burkholderiales bacterium]|nr:glycosyltransferase family 2 protein [Burkholderiales bacterium]
MKITVITVTYNSVLTLERALKSVFNQDYKNFEHIVIDGASSDGTLDILNVYRSALHCVISEPDKGIYDAMNKGLERATGEIICFLNADDEYAAHDVFSQVVDRMSEGRMDALIGDVGFFHGKNPDRTVRRYRSGRFKPTRLAWGWMPAHPAFFLRREVYQRVGGFDISYRIAGDFEHIVRVFSESTLRYRYLPKVLVRMQTGGVSTNGWKSKVLLNKEVLRACRKNGVSSNIFKVLSKYPMKLMELFF